MSKDYYAVLADVITFDACAMYPDKYDVDKLERILQTAYNDGYAAGFEECLDLEGVPDA